MTVTATETDWLSPELQVAAPSEAARHLLATPTAPAATSIQRIGIASATPTSSWRRYLTMPSEMYSGTCMTSCLFNWGVLDGEHP